MLPRSYWLLKLMHGPQMLLLLLLKGLLLLLLQELLMLLQGLL